MGREPQLAAACCDLVADVARSSGGAQLRVAGCSMVPAFWPDDLIHFTPYDFSALLAGEIIVFRQHDRFVMHRILRHNGATVTTRGDARPQADAAVVAEDCIGRVDRVLRNGRPVPLRLSHAQAGVAWLLRHSEPATYLFVRCCSVLRKLREFARLQEGASAAMGTVRELSSDQRTQG